MIELRWLRIHHNDNNGRHAGLADYSLGYVRVLQFRYVIPIYGGDSGYSDWKDIPIVDYKKEES